MSFFRFRSTPPKPLTLAVLGATAPEIESLCAEFAVAHPDRSIRVYECSVPEFQEIESDEDLQKVRYFRLDNSPIDGPPGRGIAVIDGGRRDIAAPFETRSVILREDPAIFGHRLTLL